ncbi:MAG: Rieske (2Fe-2S) domain protein [Chloroflexi bacterium]|jgi:nitrite reductase/ring-hydroxylating ferredoxin subunit|nr:Rieske (2Fe-2S) domain protein [Chloroflexota bacterium]
MSETPTPEKPLDFVRVALVSEVPVGTMKLFKIDRHQVALANIKGEFYAFNNICLHRAGPLVEGRLLGNKVTCSWHAWVYEVPTGKVIFPRDEKRCLDTYQVKIEDDAIWIARPKGKQRPSPTVQPEAVL